MLNCVNKIQQNWTKKNACFVYVIVLVLSHNYGNDENGFDGQCNDDPEMQNPSFGEFCAHFQ